MAKHPDIAQNDTRATFFRALTGNRGAALSGDVQGMLLAAFGPSQRDPHRPDTAAAAKSLGVSQRTVQRWIAGKDRKQQHPRAATLKKLTQRARQAATTRRGRERALKGRREALAREGMRLSVNGVQGPAHGEGYVRKRLVNFDLDDPRMAREFLDAWVAGGDEGAQKYLVDNVSDFYHDSWVYEHIAEVDASGLYGNSPE